MGCTSSKGTVDVYSPAPSSFAVFDINAIEEPWLKPPVHREAPDEKPSNVPAPLLEKLQAIEDAPRTWDEVSKALDDLNSLPAPPAPDSTPTPNQKPPPRKSFSFHTLEELESKPGLKKAQSTNTRSRVEVAPKPESGTGEVPKSLKDNIFILRDRQEREKEGKSSGFVNKWNPLNDFEEKCPPSGENVVVVYTTSLGGVRRTYEDCNRVRQLMETHMVAYDERDVSLHGGFLSEMRELLGEGVGVPRVFVKGRYLGGVEEVVGLNETGRLSRILNWARVERGVGRMGCEGCGGARFVPCLECGGSCKIVVVGGQRERCGECNENGLVHCPVCM
ncbi:hypothetical protein ACJIZ3_001863 [Penstemon smallii]|uniref:Glutaredoxin domain-containing protein n=1 Tax=Penstemon smallii TaxID=265156 RepID=A0ABD3U556_9LAMI